MIKEILLVCIPVAGSILLFLYFSSKIDNMESEITFLESQLKHLHTFIKNSDIPEKKMHMSRPPLASWPTIEKQN